MVFQKFIQDSHDFFSSSTVVEGLTEEKLLLDVFTICKSHVANKVANACNVRGFVELKADLTLRGENASNNFPLDERSHAFRIATHQIVAVV